MAGRWARTSLAAAALATGLTLAACGGSSDALPPGLWVAEARSATFDEPAPIRVFNPITGEERELGPPGFYEWLAWSPDGKHLAAVEVRVDSEDFSDALVLWLFDLASAEGMLLPIDDHLPTGRPEWSPDSTRLAVPTFGADFQTGDPPGVAVFGASGVHLGTVLGVALENGLSRGVGSWSPDSGYLVTMLNRHLMVAGRDGTGAAFVPSEISAETDNLTLTCWLTAQSVAVIGVSQDPDRSLDFEVEIVEGPAGLQIHSTPSDEALCPRFFPPTDPATLAEIADFAPGPSFSRPAELSADGSAEVFAAEARDPSERYTIVVRWRGDLLLVEGRTSAIGALLGTTNRLRAAVVVIAP